MKRRDTIISVIVVILIAGFIIREYQNGEIRKELNALEKEVVLRDKASEKEKEIYQKANRDADAEIVSLQKRLRIVEDKGREISDKYKKLKGNLKKAKVLKDASRSELFAEIRKYRLTLKSAEESILNLTLENQTLRKENLLWQKKFKLAEKEIIRLEEEYAVLKDNFNKAVKLGKKRRPTLAGKLVMFAAGAVVAGFIK